MKTKNRTISAWMALMTSITVATTSQAGTFNANFNDGLVPSGSQVFGNTVVESTGGVDNSGALKITKAVNSQTGSFIIEDLDAGALVYGFRASFMARVGGGTATPADGWSFNVAPDIGDGAFGEAGVGTGFTVMFDTYDNVDANPNNGAGEAPQITIKMGNQVVATSGLVPLSDLTTGSQFVPVNINVNADGSLDLDFNGKVFFSKLILSNYQPLTGARFAIGGRTGGANENCFIDDLNIETLLNPIPGIVNALQDFTMIEGASTTLSLQLNNGENAAIQWYRNGNAISGATETNYTLSAVSQADSGAKFSARVTLGTNVVNSTEALLKVTAIDLPSTPVLSFNFDDGSIPANTMVFGTAILNVFGGVQDSGVLLLTDAVNDQNGSFLIEDMHAGAPVYGIGARFDLRMGGGSETPADGFCFSFGTDLPDTGGQVEDGVGTGLSLTADVYNNGAGEAPSFTLRYGGAVVADRKVPLSAMQTGDGYADVIIRLTADGLIDFAWNGTVIFDRVAVPGFSSISSGRIGLYARTGGLNEIHAVDNLRIYTFLSADVVRITTQPASQVVLAGKPVTFNVAVNLPETTTYQWFRNGTPISGATQDSLTLDTTSAADQGAKITVTIKRDVQSLISEEAILSVLDIGAPTNPQISYDFNNGLPVGSEISGTTLVDTAGGVNDSGVLKITLAENGQSGGFRSELVAGGGQMQEFTIAVDVLAGGGSTPPADGFSINVGSDVTVTPPGEAENGGGTGLTIAFDTYDNGGGEAPSIDVKYKGQVLVSTKVPPNLLNVADTYFTVLIRVKQDGTLDLAHGDSVIYFGYKIPGYVPLSGARIAVFARTGGLNSNYWFDNLRLGATMPNQITITGEPSDALVLVGQPATFTVQVSNPQGVTYEWSRDGVVIPNSNQSTYTTAALSLSDEGAVYSVKATGPGNTLTSRGARVNMMSAFTVAANPVYNIDFNDGVVPAGGILFGNAYLEEGFLKLTINENDQSSSFLLETPAGAAPINDFVATWKMRVGGGSAVPADGCSFVLGEDIPDAAFGEDGAGSGLVVVFDIYDNGGGEAPAMDILYKGDVVASRKFDFSILDTGDAFVQVGVRVNRTGTLDLYYENTAVYRDLPLPGFTPFGTGRFGWGARTGGQNENQWVDDVKISLNTQPPPVEKLEFTQAKSNPDGTITGAWTGGGTLQTAATVNGPFMDVPGASSPYTFTPTTPTWFARVRK
jgi:hypothetical protein